MPFIQMIDSLFSFSDSVAQGVGEAYDKLAIGYILMFTYTMFVVSRLGRVGNRAYLAIAGILSVVFGLGSSFGVMFALGFKFNQVHGVLPFLAMGKRMWIIFHQVGKQSFEKLDMNSRSEARRKRVARFP